jgi:hypothetical protein
VFLLISLKRGDTANSLSGGYDFKLKLGSSEKRTPSENQQSFHNQILVTFFLTLKIQTAKKVSNQFCDSVS